MLSLHRAYHGIVGGVVIILCLMGMAQAQVTGDTTATDHNIIERNVEISGQAGAYGELYGISGRDGRRPSSTGRLFIRPSITFLNELTLNINVLLSTEGISARQNINKIGLDPSWSWGSAHIGDFSESFSNYTLNGVTIRGGGITLTPGEKFRFSAVGGRTQRAVSGGAGNKSYSRTIYGAKLGIGSRSGSHVELMFLKAKDDVGSLPPDSTLVTPGAIRSDTTDTSMVGNAPPVNPFAVTPQENLVGGINWQLNVIPDKLTWTSEVSGSVFTRDLRSNKVDADDLDIPDFATNFYTPRFSSSADFVATTDLSLRLSSFNIQTGYKWIGPGYRSLGTSYLINDQQEFNSRISFRLSNTSISLNWARINDNLLNQKQFTQVQNRYGGTITNRFTDFWNSSLTANIISRGNDADSDSAQTSFNNLVLSTSQNFTFSENTVFQNLSLNYSFQRSNNESGLQFENTNKTHNINTNLGLSWTEKLSSSAKFGLISSTVSDTMQTVTTTYGASVRHRALEDKLSNSLSFSASVRERAVSYRTRINSSYKLTDKDQLSLSLGMTNFNRSGGSGSSFSEFTGSLRITHSF